MSARQAAIWCAIALGALNGAVGLFGIARWYLSAPSRAFWIAVRVAQTAAFAYALLVGALVLDHHHPSSNLFYLYALLPIVIGFVAEQLRVVSADQVLVARDLEDAQAVGRLPAEEQHGVVLAILRREMIVMALAALVVCFLALRAAGTF